MHGHCIVPSGSLTFFDGVHKGSLIEGSDNSMLSRAARVCSDKLITATITWQYPFYSLLSLFYKA